MFQVRPHPNGGVLVLVFGEYLGIDIMSADNAVAIRGECVTRSLGGPTLVRLDPAANQRTSLGPVAYKEYENVFGPRITARWPMHPVVDGLEQVELLLGGLTGVVRLLIHPRCKHLIAAMQNYARQKRGGEFLDRPLDHQPPHEDMVDALRGGIRDAFPEGAKPISYGLSRISARRVC